MVNFLIILKILISLLPLIEARTVEIRSSTSEWSPSYFSNYTFYLQNGSISCELDLIRTLVKDIKVDLEFQIRLSNSKKYQTLFTHNVDICSMLNAFKDTMFKRLFKTLFKHSNLMQNCPIEKGHYYLHSWRMDSSLIPSYLYAGDYRLKSRGYISKTLKNHTKVEDFVLLLTADAVLMD